VRIALFDQVVAAENPAGSRDQRIVEQLSGEHEFTLFASAVVLKDGGTRAVAHVPVPTVRRPALVSYLAYLVGSLRAYAGARARGRRFDILHVTDCYFPSADVYYAHFCHRAYLRDVWPVVRGPVSPRRVHNWITHLLRAAIEARLVRGARIIVAPSEGLKREMGRVYPGSVDKIRVIQNTVDLARFTPAETFDPRPLRARLDTAPGETAFVFVALGHFERKGLPLVLEALARGDRSLDGARLWVVGGEPYLVRAYRRMAEEAGVGDRVSFAGKVDDVRPYLWSADAFVSPSHYEAFSLGLLEAGGAGLPLLASRISGSDELLVDAVNGFELELSGAGVASGMARFLALDGEGRAAMRRAARASVEPLQPGSFDAAWRELYASLEASLTTMG
jgi:glycosyltransferase involved in cell wall biosynthesis